MEPKLDDTQCGFVPAVAPQKKFLLSRKYSRNHGNMSKTYTHVLSAWGNYMARFLVKCFGWCCGSTVLTRSSCWRPADRQVTAFLFRRLRPCRRS